MDGLAEDESYRFRPPKSVQEEDSLRVQSKPKSTSRPLKLSELGKKRASKNSVYVVSNTRSWWRVLFLCSICFVLIQKS